MQQDEKWSMMCRKLFEFSLTSRFEPDASIDPELYKWYRSQKTLLSKGKLKNDRQEQFIQVSFELPANRRKWIRQYEKLILFRKENPSRWPVYDKKFPDSEESQLAVFCQIIRDRYRKRTLESFWIEKFQSIQLNFDGRKDNWLEYYYSVESIIAGRESISISEIGDNPYNWLYKYKKLYDENRKLTEDQRRLIEKLNLDRFFTSWDTHFTNVSEWKNKYSKFPTRLSNRVLHSWLYSQRTCYKKGSLNKEQIQKLESIGFDLIGLGVEADEMRWKEQFKRVKLFRDQNSGRWPSYYSDGEEKKLYNWCQSQRQAQAGTHSSGRKKKLEEWKVSLLNSLEFSWTYEDVINKNWDLNYSKVQNFKMDNPSKNIPSRINGKTNPLYAWLLREKRAYKTRNYSPAKYQKLKEIGLDLDPIV